MNGLLEKIRAQVENLGRRAARFLGPVPPMGAPLPARVPVPAKTHGAAPRRSR